MPFHSRPPLGYEGVRLLIVVGERAGGEGSWARRRYAIMPPVEDVAAVCGEDPGVMTSTRDGTPISRREYERLARQNQTLSEQVRALLVLQSIANTLSAELDLPVLLRQVALAAVRLASGSASVLYLFDARGENLVVEAVETGGPPPLANGAYASERAPGTSILAQSHPGGGPRLIPLGQGLAGQVAMTAEPVLVNEPQADPRFPASVIAVDASVLGISPCALICVPLLFKGQVMGALAVAQTQPNEGFDARDLDLLQTLAAQAATAVTNARLYQNLLGERDRIIAAQEDVRKQLARDLHDGPAQSLAQIAMSLDFAKKLAQFEPEKVPSELQKLHEQAVHTTRDIRNLLFDLRPLVLESEGLEAALRRFLERFQAGDGPDMHFEAHYTTRLPHNAEAVTFAIVQEAVNNVLKHAQAQNCWIEIHERPQTVVVVVRDDGQGFDVNSVKTEYERRGSWGLLNMSERATLAGATLGIRSQPGQGTVVMLSVPHQPQPSWASDSRG
jgi:signal transduction histidine kinase